MDERNSLGSYKFIQAVADITDKKESDVQAKSSKVKTETARKRGAKMFTGSQVVHGGTWR